MRDRFLLLTAASLLSSGQKEEAEKVRVRLLELNPSHLLKPFPSLAGALKSRDVRDYIEGLKRSYSPQAAGQLLDSMRQGEAAPAQAKPPAPLPASQPVLPALEPIATPARPPSTPK